MDMVPDRVANKMDENIFKFNKVIIDTVYDIICAVYPVRGTDRDFARFYVGDGCSCTLLRLSFCT